MEDEVSIMINIDSFADLGSPLPSSFETRTLVYMQMLNGLVYAN